MKAKLTGLSILTLTVALLVSCDPGVRWNPQAGGPNRTGAWEPTPHGLSKEQEEETQRNFNKLYAKQDEARLEWDVFAAEVERLSKTARQARNGWLHGIWTMDRDCSARGRLVGYKITDGKHVTYGSPRVGVFPYRDVIWSKDKLTKSAVGGFDVLHKLSDRHMEEYSERPGKARLTVTDYYRCE